MVQQSDNAIQQQEPTAEERIQWFEQVFKHEGIREALGEDVATQLAQQMRELGTQVCLLAESHDLAVRKANDLEEMLSMASRELHMLEKAEQPRMVELLAGEMAPMMGVFNRDLVRFLNVLLGHHDLGVSMQMLIREMVTDAARMAMEDEIMDADAMSEIEF